MMNKTVTNTFACLLYNKNSDIWAFLKQIEIYNNDAYILFWSLIFFFIIVHVCSFIFSWKLYYQKIEIEIFFE